MRVLEFLSSRDVKVNTFHFNAIIGSAGGDTGWTCALNLMEQMKRKDVPMSAGTYGAAIKSCSKANEWKAALSILSSMEAIASNEIAYSAAIKSFERDGLWERALDLLFHMSAVTLQADIICISAAMATSAAAGQWQVALQLFHDILHNSQVFENCRPDVISFNTLISAMGPRWEAGIAILKEAKSWLIIPNMISFNSAISTCDKAGEWQLAISLMEEASQARLFPGIVTFNSCINACQESSSWTISLQLFHAMPMRRLKPDVISFTSAIGVLSQAGLWQKACHLLEDMLERIVCPNERTYGALMVASVKSSEWPLSLSLLNQLCQTERVRPNSVICNAAISALEKGYKWEIAFELLQKMKSEDLADEISWNSAISSCEKCGEWEMAIQLLFTFLNGNKIKSNKDQSAGAAVAPQGDVQAVSPGLIAFNAAISACEEGDMSGRNMMKRDQPMMKPD